MTVLGRQIDCVSTEPHNRGGELHTLAVAHTAHRTTTTTARQRLQTAPQRHLACADSQATQALAAGAITPKRSASCFIATQTQLARRYEAREQKADGAWRWKGG